MLQSNAPSHHVGNHANVTLMREVDIERAAVRTAVVAVLVQRTRQVGYPLLLPAVAEPVVIAQAEVGIYAVVLLLTYPMAIHVPSCTLRAVLTPTLAEGVTAGQEGL